MPRALLTAAAALLSLALAACSAFGLDRLGLGGRSDPAASMSGPGSVQAGAYVRAAGESDVFEITSSQLALQRTQDPDVRAFATMMIDHHTKTTNRLLAATRTAGMTPPPAVLSPPKRGLIEQLNSQAGLAFDRLYVRQQAAAHQEALALHSGYAQTGDTPALRAAAAAATPVVQAHLARVRTLQAVLGGDPSM